MLHMLIQEPQGCTSSSAKGMLLRARGRLPFPLQDTGYAYPNNIYQKNLSQ